jgi:hypothetical protein
MYSGTTFRTKSGRVIGVHQKIDRVARRHVAARLPKRAYFPTTQEILHFEGLNGPDGIKRKSPARDEPWHYIDPTDHTDRAIVDMINDHLYNMTQALIDKNHQRAAFEAAWMAHAIVDGLTPAHHYPLEAKLEELRGEGLETRTSTKEKLLLPGNSRRQRLRNNWEFWGAKGVMTTHVGFELGVATTIAAQKFDDTMPIEEEFRRIENDGFEPVFFTMLQQIADMKMYDEFTKLGWTRHLARETRDVLVPDIIKTVALAWYQAVYQSRQK